MKPKEGGEIRATAQRLPEGLTFDLSHGAQVLLEAVVKLGVGDGLEVTGVNTPGGGGVAAFTHAGVVAQAPLVQVWVRQGVLRRNALGLEGRHNQGLRKGERRRLATPLMLRQGVRRRDSLDRTPASCRGGGPLRGLPGWTACTGQEVMAAQTQTG